VHVLIAPQEFRGSLSADEAAHAIAKGLRRTHPDWTLDRCPMSDGGPGLLDALRFAIKADTSAAVVRDPLGRNVLARYLRIRDTGDLVLEAAQANGTWHIKPAERNPLFSDTAGVGDLLRDAIETAGATRVIIGVGGSATTDGGAGMAQALGARFTDMAGNALSPGGAPLADLARIDWQPPAFLAGVTIDVATDVTNPLVGPNGAATVYGPQKGATPADVDILEAALVRYAAVVRRQLGVDIADFPGAGAAGGLAGGLVAFLGAKIGSGFDLVADAVHLRARLAAADLVITGEGSFDSQSLQGKVTGRIVEMAHAAGKRIIVLAGRVEALSAEVRTLAELESDTEAAMANAAALLADLAAQIQ
jgi:glycerate 2-kinase